VQSADPAGHAAGGRPGAPARLAPLVWLAAGLGYASITTVAALASGRETAAKAVVAGILNALPEALAAPLAWRWATAPAGGAARAGRRRALQALLLGATFGLWTAAASNAAFHLWRAIETPGTAWRLEPVVAVWRFAMGVLVFAALAGLGTAARRSREADEALRLAERAEAVRARAELATLRSQLEPHFLLNVLHSLVGVVERDPPRAAAMLERLGDLLRDALRVHAEARDEIALEEELAITRRYLEIERLRLGERLAVDWRIEADDRARRVPPFALQGLVENAVRHAVAPRSGGGTIAIAVEERDGELLVTVDDDGDGAARPRGGAGVGLELLRERLRLLHGEAARVEAGARAGGGFRARFALPAESGEGEPA
jgi:hypothetical protein